MRLLYVTGLAPSTASLSGTAFHASVFALQDKKKALSVKAFDPSRSNAFTLRAIFHSLPCCLTAVGCLQVPGRTPDHKVPRIVAFIAGLCLLAPCIYALLCPAGQDCLIRDQQGPAVLGGLCRVQTLHQMGQPWLSGEVGMSPPMIHASARTCMHSTQHMHA